MYECNIMEERFMRELEVDTLLVDGVENFLGKLDRSNLSEVDKAGRREECLRSYNILHGPRNRAH